MYNYYFYFVKEVTWGKMWEKYSKFEWSARYEESYPSTVW